MKKLFLVIAGLALAVHCVQVQQDLPRLAVVEFDVNANTPKVNQDSVTVRNLVESQMVAAQKYEVITRTDIDQLLANQQIQASAISSPENIRKLQLQNISYIVTGLVNALGDNYAVTVKILDVSTGQFSHSASDIMGGASRDLHTGVNTLVAKFVAGIKTYKVGDFGPGGGWIFYDKGRVTDGWRYLEAAPSETEFTAQWGAYQRDVGGTATAVGRGKRNTQAIIAYLQRIGESGKAAQLCDSLSAEGYDDWFLPSKDELNLMYTNLKTKGLGEFGGGWYWSSSEFYSYGSWFQRFSVGGQDYGSKSLAHSVRAVRAF